MASPFDPRAAVAENALAFAVRDRFPVSEGHTLVVPRREVATWFDATREEQLAILELVDVVRAQLDQCVPKPDGYNVGFNAGAAAGQTVMHLHVHVIPRYRGDVDDPRGGVRHVIPGKGNYLTSRAAPLATGGEDDPFARHVLPLFAVADDVAIVAAFIQSSGLDRIAGALRTALARGAHVRIVTGDYLDITQADALEDLLDLESASHVADDDGDDDGAPAAPPGRLETRVIETATLPGRTRAFHPKSWRFESATLATAFVGSSNLSRSALDTGIEWNLRVDRAHDAQGYARVRDAFEQLWPRARKLDAKWIAEYAARARARPAALPPGEAEPDALAPLPAPHAVQAEALAALARAREAGRTRALVVLATGLGKTLLAALDWRALRDELGRTPRLLFLAHRRELLTQAARTWRRLCRELGLPARIGWYVEDGQDLDADLVFASVPKLARATHLAKLATERFDYVVVDEVHHAAAGSYRRILAKVSPVFLLGLTATPDRADQGDVLGLFDDFIAYRADVARGVALGRLVPFRYYGVKDEIDYENLPWRNRRFDPDELARAAQTEARMATLWRAWELHPGTRTLVFCCSIEHAKFVRTWLRARGVKVAAVFSAEGSDDRDEALAALGTGGLAALCAVDVFNEGVDVPSIDRVVMLRPTESPVIFLQQLGRGLRTDADKTSLTVIDFVGNHRVFLERVRTLLSLAGPERAPTLRAFLVAGAAELSAGCSVELELEAKELLASLLGSSAADEVERAYDELRTLRGRRPTAGELYRAGYLPSRLRDRHGSYLDFVRTRGDLTAEETRTLDTAGAFLRELETTEMTKSFKMVLLETLLEHDALASGMAISELAQRSLEVLRRAPELWEDVPEGDRPEGDDAASARRWLGYWKKNPIEAWTRPKKQGRAWFKLDGDRFALDLAVPVEVRDTLDALTRELADYRLAQYRRRGMVTTTDGFVCAVTWNQRDPILKLPDRTKLKLPEGETDVRLDDGSVWQFRFQKEFCNVARPAGRSRNELPDLLRGWFGPGAGKPGTTFRVRFRSSPDGLWIEPEVARVIELGSRRSVVTYPDLRAAAGHARDAIEAPEAEHVVLPVEGNGTTFAVRVSGSSMDGGVSPLRDGDWAVLKLARGAPASSVLGRVVLVELPGEKFGHQYQLKRLAQREGKWWLTSDSADGPEMAATEDMTVIARLDRAVRPEDLAPERGAVVAESELGATFGLGDVDGGVRGKTGRYGGHLFVFVSSKGMLEAPGIVKVATMDGPTRPGETAFVLARRKDGSWRYLGVGKRREEDGGARWEIAEVDFETWRAWGDGGRSASRALPEGALTRASVVVDALLGLPEDERWIERPGGGRARIVGRAKQGGLRIVGAEESGSALQERTISLIDIAWVAVAADEVATNGGDLDEERVNRARYLEGTPKGSTRWIDTGWAIGAWSKRGGPTHTA